VLASFHEFHLLLLLLLLLLLSSCLHACSGFHEFAEFVAEDVGTVDSGLNSMVLANNNEMVLLPINEPTFGTKRKSQIQVRSYRCAATAGDWWDRPFNTLHSACCQRCQQDDVTRVSQHLALSGRARSRCAAALLWCTMC
jgi:hypothetical protein